MASTNQAPVFLLTALILFAAANPLSHAVLPGLLSPILGGVSGVVNSITPVVPAVTGIVAPAVSCAVNSVTPVVPAVTGLVAPAVSGVVNGVTPAVPAVTGVVAPAVSGVTGAVSGLLSGLNVTGLLCCTANGNCPAGATGIVGAVVKLSCTNLVGARVTVGQGSTGANGGFDISVTNLLSTVGGLLNPNATIPCNVFVQLPLNEAICPILSAVTGILSSALSTVESVIATADGLIGSVTALTFSLSVTVQA